MTDCKITEETGKKVKKVIFLLLPTGIKVIGGVKELTGEEFGVYVKRILPGGLASSDGKYCTLRGVRFLVTMALFYCNVAIIQRSPSESQPCKERCQEVSCRSSGQGAVSHSILSPSITPAPPQSK